MKAYLGRVAYKLVSLTFGAAFVGGPGTLARRVGDRKEPRPRFSGRTAVVAHAYYVDIIPELIACHSTLPADADLILTTPHDRVAAATRAVESVPGVRVVGIDNRGRDIAPFLQLLADGALEPYDAVLKLHTKRSPHLRDGDIRRRLLFTLLAGSRRRTGSILEMFEDDRTGLVGWGMAWRHRPNFWMANEARVADLAVRMGLPPRGDPAFFEGSMFWVRPAALERLRALRLQADDFEAEDGQLDGALHHAIERVFALSVIASGGNVRDLTGRHLAGVKDSLPLTKAP